MTDYGQSIPPTWFRDTLPKQFTKTAFVAFLHRALLTAGMQEIVSMSPPGWDLSDPSQDQRTVVSGDQFVWFYDFPTTETFTFNNQTYRPILAICFMWYDSASPSPGGVVGESFAMQLMYRRSDRVLGTDFIGYNNQLIFSTAYGFGLVGGNSIGSYGGQEGSYYYFPKWKPYASYNATAFYPNPQGVRNFHVFLGRGGLLIQVGTGVGKTDNNDILSFLVLFGGARIPGRARIPNQDFNLNRINPTLALPLGSQTDGRYYATQFPWTFGNLYGNRLGSFVLGMQHNLKSTNQPVLAMMCNLENIERPILPVADIDTKSSPRTLDVGGAHVLIRLAYVTWYRAGTTTDFYGPLDPSIRPEPVWTWQDVWTAPAFRLCDRTAPIGVFLDPTPSSPGPAGIHWFLFRAAGINAMLAVDAEGVTEYTAAVLPGVTLENNYHLDFAPGGLSGPFTPTTAVTQSGGWTPTSSVDEVLIDWAYGSNNPITFHISTPPLTPSEYYTMSFDLFNKADSARTFGSLTDPVHLEFSLDGSSWAYLGPTSPTQGINAFENTGTDNTKPYYAYTAVPEIRVPQAPDGTIWFRISADYGPAGIFDTRHTGIRNVRLRKYQR